jgi:MoxR-like ATPase
MSPTQNGPFSDTDAVALVHTSFAKLKEQAAGIIVGLEDVTEQIFITLICRGHCILEGVPGLAKTRLISTLASLTHLSFRRVQFTPDLMPGDITGSDVLEEDRSTGGRVFRFIRGPLFGNVVLADEINRTPPKTQSALLEAMEERQLTVGGQTYTLPDPFFVLATQNPIEQEGTYPLPEAQLDRFMLKIVPRLSGRGAGNRDRPAGDEHL